MKSRSRFLLRSIFYGTLPKISGGLVLVLGLPLISSKMASQEYIVFLTFMSIASLLTLPTGIFVFKTISDLSGAMGKDVIVQIHNSLSVFTFYSITVVMVSIPFCFFVFEGGDTYIGLLVVILTSIQCFLRWAYAYRVAFKTDYVFSIFQMVGNAVTLFMFLLFDRFSLLSIVLIYFSIPVLTHYIASVGLSLGIQGLMRAPYSAVFKWLYDAWYVLVHELNEYYKLFIFPIVVSFFITEIEYSVMFTFMLFAARMVNPIALITRPLIPAIIDAEFSGDIRWRYLLIMYLSLFLILLIGISMSLGIYLFYSYAGFVFPVYSDEIDLALSFGFILYFISQTIVAFIVPIFLVGGSKKAFASSGFVTIVFGTALGFYLYNLSGYDFAFFIIGMGLATLLYGVVFLIREFRLVRKDYVRISE